MDSDYDRRLAKRKRNASLFQAACVAAVLLALAMLLALLYSVISEGWSWLSLELITQSTTARADAHGLRGATALFPAIVGTLWVMVICIVVSFTIGVSAAVYLVEYARPNRVSGLIQTNVQNLAAVPSILYGILGLVIFVGLFSLGKSVLSAGLMLALLIMPVVIVSAQESIRAVPPTIREGGYALGATKWQVITRLVLPQAIPGILTGIILAVSRAMGEAAPLVVLGALSYVATPPSSPLDRFTVLPIQIFVWISKPQAEFHELAAAGIIVLLIMLLGMNALAIFLRNRLQKNLRG